jgi:hypothetical protein
MKLNKYHALYLTSHPLVAFLRDKKIKYSAYSQKPEELIALINQNLDAGKIEEEDLILELDDWMYQGTKKVVMRYLNKRDISKYSNKAFLLDFIEKQFTFSTRFKGLKDLNVSNEKFHLIDYWYYDDSEDENKISGFVLVYVEMIKYKPPGTTYEETRPFPVFVTVDIENNEISSRVNSKSNIYNQAGSSIDDIQLGKEYLERVLLKLKGSTSIRVEDISSLEKAFFELHDYATELPESITLKADELEAEIQDFITKMREKLDLSNSELYQDEMYNNIKHVVIKQIIRNCEDKDIFIDGKDVISIGINASGSSLSKLNYKAPGSDPVQATPEYQNIKSVLSETERIGKNILMWKSDSKPDGYIRSKLFLQDDGYGIISFEEYVFEEDIEYVLSKIRGFKSS